MPHTGSQEPCLGKDHTETYSQSCDSAFAVPLYTYTSSPMHTNTYIHVHVFMYSQLLASADLGQGENWVEPGSPHPSLTLVPNGDGVKGRIYPQSRVSEGHKE